MKKAVLQVRLPSETVVDVEAPLHISADELIHALHEALRLPGPCPAAVRCENPIALLCGGAPLDAFGVREGSILYL